MKGHEIIINILFTVDLDENYSHFIDSDINAVFKLIKNYDYYLTKYHLTLERMEFEPVEFIKRGRIIFTGVNDRFEGFYMMIRDFEVNYLEMMGSKKIIVNKRFKR